MSLWNSLDNLVDLTDRIRQDGHAQRAAFTKVIAGVVAMAQKHRNAKRYDISDELRAILKSAGIDIVNGTSDYSYDQIPKQLRGRPVNDTWEWDLSHNRDMT